MTFPLHVPLTGSGLDRAAELRTQAKTLDKLLRAPQARLLAMAGGKFPIDLAGAPRVDWSPVSEAILAAATDKPVFLGRDDGAPRFAVELKPVEDPRELGFFSESVKFIDLRSIAPDLQGGEATVLTEAKSLLDWHSSHRMCSRCGAPSDMAEGGWRRDCPSCGAKHFPRTDPVTIMLLTRRHPELGDRVVMGRKHGWPEGLFSLLAGYVEPGETIEDAARRESFEEAGVRVGEVRYLASQPWPFPSTLMIGVYAEGLSDELVREEEELEEIDWFTKADILAALAGEHPRLMAPRKDAIARILVEAWATDQLEL
ncbi:MAG: NAD(+) diphosphatase [Pseudomonadota bacterium]